MSWKWSGMILLAASAIAQDSDWQTLQSLHADARVSVVMRDGKLVQGRFASWSPEAIGVASNRGVRTLRAGDVRRVTVQQKSSRWKGAMVGALVGFGIGFPFGAAFAGHITDRNSPGFVTRTGMGAGFGMFTAGIAAPIGALTGGKKQVTVYRDRP